ncbi:MAG: DUF2937 family protein [Pseudomonadota bacterium]
MILRTLALLGGLTGAFGASQYPEFYQQYYQRLSGAVDELRVISSAFDTSARLAGKTREEALRDIRGTQVADDMRETIADSLVRYDRLSRDLAVLESAPVGQRLVQPWRMRDTKLVQRTWEAYEPGVPVTTEGFLATGTGFLIGWAVIAGVLSLLLSPFRRLRRA